MSALKRNSAIQGNPSRWAVTTSRASWHLARSLAGLSQNAILLALTCVILLAQGCATAPPRNNPLPQELSSQAQIPGIPAARYWGDEPPPFADMVENASAAQLRERFPALYRKPFIALAISGGGSNGAFTAGLINGWTAAGTRPTFSVVTGISTGALCAPFVFLGPAYDAKLKEVFTEYSTKDLVIMRGKWDTIRNDSAADSAPLRAMIAKYIDDAVMQEIATEYRKGRFLYISTTNLDAMRPVVWNIGRIAASGAPGALDLIHDAMLASASIPVAFPPMMIEVEANGQRFEEMHVDGGVTRQSFLFSFGLDNKELLRKLKAKSATAYIIRNSKLQPKWEIVERNIPAIAGRSVDSLIRTQGIYDFHREYTGTMQYGFDFNLVYIPNDFEVESNEPFDPVYMNKLYERGYKMGKEGVPWLKAPPGIKPLSSR
jgi:hypothetical protein